MTRTRLQPLDLSAAADEAPTPAAAPPSEGKVRSAVEALTAAPEDDLGFARNAYTVALAAGLLWAGTLTAYTLFDRPAATRATGGGPLALLVFGGVVALPIAFMLLAAYATRQAARLAAETRRARALAGELVGPAAIAAAGAGDALEAVRIGIAQATEAAAEAGRTLTELREALAAESAQLTRAAAEANRATGRLTAAFRRERDGLTELAGSLETTAQSMTDAVAHQAELVTGAADLARARGEEARAEIAGQAAELNAAVEGVAESAVSAGQQLAGQTERLERAAAFLGERYRGMEAALADRHQAVLGLTDLLREEQSQASTLLETQRAELAAATAEARAGADAITSAAEEAAARLRAMEGWGEEQTRAVANAARTQQEGLRRQAEADLTALEQAVASARETTEAEALRALDRLAAAAEATLTSSARRTEEAERETTERLRAELAALDEASRSAQDRAAEAVETVFAHARRTVEQSVAEAQIASRAAAAEPRAPVPVAAPLPVQRSPVPPSPVQQAVEVTPPPAVVKPANDRAAAVSRALEASASAAAVAGNARSSRPEAAPASGRTEPPELTAPAYPSVVSGPRPPETMAASAPMSGSEAAGLRPRLKLTPAGAEERPAGDPSGPILFDSGLKPGSILQPPQAPPKRSDDWTWKDLLDVVEEEPVRDEDTLAEDLRAEIQAMGVDAGALLPTPRIDEIAHALQSGDAAGARDLVSRSAPAAIRRLSRRVLTDKVLRAQADRHVKHYDILVTDTARRDQEGHMTAALLGSEPGRTYLLLEAAFRELH